MRAIKPGYFLGEGFDRSVQLSHVVRWIPATKRDIAANGSGNRPDRPYNSDGILSTILSSMSKTGLYTTTYLGYGAPELGTFNIRRYHFDDESFVHHLHNVRFDPDRPYKVPIETLMADQPLSSSDKGRTSARGSHRSKRSSPTPHYSPRMSSSTRRVVSPSPTVVSSSLRRRVAGKMLRLPKSWELSSSSEGWMCKGDEEEKEIGGMEPSVKKKEASKEDEEEKDPEEEEENSEEELPASTSLPMDIDATEDCLQFIEELERNLENSPSIVVML
ncbi:hypothetical protein PIB30_038515 [Stylosanthes scabra]|uniref:Uncharacterized protein n=1 Tax=Stylosanthes scabra TaxID=79078 RepID=A0ABU6UCN3_9FABA|nr:hypothetical protein [Stylosanthes scabra]